jgi:hypothetical protein
MSNGPFTAAVYSDRLKLERGASINRGMGIAYNWKLINECGVFWGVFEWEGGDHTVPIAFIACK